jgi:hypothetical protein
MGKVAAVALPVLGAVFGGPLGAGLMGGLVGTTAGTMIGAGIGSGLGSYVTGGDFLKGATMGALGSGVGQLFGGASSGGGGLFEGGGGAASAGPDFSSVGASGGGEALGAFGGGGAMGTIPAGVGGATDSIEAIDALLRGAPEGMGATQAAQSFGFGSTESLLGAANPAFVNTSPFMQSASNSLNDMGMPQAAKAVGGGLAGVGEATGFSQLSRAVSPVTKFMGGGGGAGASSGVGLIGGVGSIYSGIQAQEQAKKLQEMAQQEMTQNNANRTTDAMDPYRAGYAAQLQGLMNDPSSIASTPGYSAGLQAINRSLAAQGFTGSGNAQAALAKYGGDFYGQQVERLRQLASGGGQNNPSNSGAYSAYSNGANLQGQGLASIGYGLRGMGF